MKKCVELHVATNPCGSSISASSAPAFAAWIHAWMQLSFECELSFWSCISGAVRRIVEVKSEIPSGLADGALYSGMMTMVASPIVTRGS
ncbi:hypothetical protein D3C87_1898170 [compost metagenome]